MEPKKTPAKRKIFIVDDHPIFRAGLVQAIEQEPDLDVCGEASDAAEGLKKIEGMKPELAIVDLAMEGMNGLELIKQARSRWPKLRLLVLSMHKETLYAERALKAGANGYIMKVQNGDTLLAAIRTVLDGRTYLSEDVNQAIIDKLTNPKVSIDDPESLLSDREFETFQLMGRGLGSRQIADALHISIKTVEAHREHMRAKFGIESSYQLVQRAIEWVHGGKNLI